MAYHESGHALLGMLPRAPTRCAEVTIIPRGQALGVTCQSPQADRYSYGEAYLRGRIVGALGGRAAEELVFGGVTTGAENDLEQATQIARQMVGRWGMSAAVGPVTVLPRRARSSRSVSTASRRRPGNWWTSRSGGSSTTATPGAADTAEQPRAARPAGPHALRPGDPRGGRGVRRRRRATGTWRRPRSPAARPPVAVAARRACLPEEVGTPAHLTLPSGSSSVPDRVPPLPQ